MINFLLSHSLAKCPMKSRPTSAAYDLYTPEKHVILSGEIKAINTHFRCILDDHSFALILGKSKLGTRGLVILGGVIDNDYRGDWVVCVLNTGDTYITFDSGDAVAQFVILPMMTYGFHEVNTLNETDRGESGILDADKRK